MSDFQDYLNQALSNIVFQDTDRDPQEEGYDIYQEVRDQIKKTREEAHLTQKQLAVLSGLTQSNISNIEKGVSKPTIDSLKKIADSIGKRLIIEFVDREVMM